jgi:hypothetical protein
LRGQPPRFDHPQVGGHLVTRLQENDVAGDKVGPIHGNPPPIAQYCGLRRKHAPDRRHRRLGLALLNEADHRIRQHHGQDHAGIDPMLQGSCHYRSTDQHIDQHIVELPQERDQRPAHLHLGQSVWSMFSQPPRSLGGGQAIRGGGKIGKAVGGGGGVRVGQLHVIRAFWPPSIRMAVLSASWFVSQ